MINKVVIRSGAKEEIISETLAFKSTETGGVLCGYYKEDAIIIASASGPGPKAYHSEIEFIMDKEHMDQFLDNEYACSKGMNIYVGEWHSHPQVYPWPSEQDYISMYERTYEWQNGEIVFFIVGFKNFAAEKLEKQIIAIYFNREEDKFMILPIEFI